MIVPSAGLTESLVGLLCRWFEPRDTAEPPDRVGAPAPEAILPRAAQVATEPPGPERPEPRPAALPRAPRPLPAS